MKKLLRIVSLAMLVALVVSALPAMAATTNKARYIKGETLYTGTTDHYLEINNWTFDEKDVTVTSSDPAVLKVDKDFHFHLIPRKAGKAKITVKFKVNGKRHSLAKTFTVKKYPNAVKSVRINNNRITLEADRKLRCDMLVDYYSKTSVVNLTPNSGWKITSIKAVGYRMSDDKQKAVTVRNNKAFSIVGYSSVTITYTLKKGAETFKYKVSVERDCY